MSHAAVAVSTRDVELSPAEQLGASHWKLKKSRIRISPGHTTRASSIGEPCERKLFYSRTAGELAAPHAPELQAIFDLGRGLEPFVLRELEDMGVEILQRERDYLDRERELSGRADAKLRFSWWERALPGELKTLNPYTAESIETIADIRDSRQHWIRKYYDQLQIYIHFDDAPAGVFVLLNKVNGQLSFIDCPRDQARIDELLAKAARIRDAVRANEPPPRHETDDCARCPFVAICAPGRTNAAAVQIVDWEEAEALIARKLELSEVVSEAAAIDRQLKKLLPEVAELVVGEFAITAKKVERAGYTVAPSSYWQRSYRRLNG